MPSHFKRSLLPNWQTPLPYRQDFIIWNVLAWQIQGWNLLFKQHTAGYILNNSGGLCCVGKLSLSNKWKNLQIRSSSTNLQSSCGHYSSVSTSKNDFCTMPVIRKQIENCVNFNFRDRCPRSYKWTKWKNILLSFCLVVIISLTISCVISLKKKNNSKYSATSLTISALLLGPNHN